MVGSCNRRPRYEIIPQKVTSVAIIGGSGRRVRLAALLVTPREAVYPAIQRRSRPGLGDTTGAGGYRTGRVQPQDGVVLRAVSRSKRRARLTSRAMGLWITYGGMRVAEGLSVST